MANPINSADSGTPPEDNHGRAAYGPGSTTQGGSNFGQGSSHIEGSSNKQGSEMNRGSNYTNEADALGDSTTGTSNEGAQSSQAGAPQEAPFDDAQSKAGANPDALHQEPQKRVNLGSEDNLGA